MSDEKKGFFEEFKEFVSRGSVLDMAVGIIVGSAFTAIVSSLVNDIITPAIGKLIGGIDLSALKVVLTAAAGDAPEVAILYGAFLQSVVNFLLVSFCVFLFVRAINRLRRKKDDTKPAVPEPGDEVKLLTEIRDLLKKDDG